MIASVMPGKRGLQAILDDIRNESGVPGIGLALSVKGKTQTAVSGVAALETEDALTAAARFEMSCLMKFLVSLVVLELAAAGEISLSAPIGDYLPELKGDNGGKAETITAAHLLSHASGYRGLDITDMKVRWSASWERFAEHFRIQPPSFPAGAVFNYEHSEHVVLGEVLHRVTGKSARDLVRARILTPLGIETGNRKSDRSRPARAVADHVYSPASQGFSQTAMPPFCAFWDASLPDRTIALKDVVRVAAALSDPQNSLFSSFTRQSISVPRVNIPRALHSSRQSEKLPAGFGLCCAQYPGGIAGHNGSMLGQTCSLRFDPDTGTAIVVGVNARSTFARDSALHRIWAATTNAPDQYPEPVADGFSAQELLGYFSAPQVAGKYVGSYLGEVTISQTDGGLRFDVGPEGNRRSTFHIARDDSGRYRFHSRMPVSATFLPDPSCDAPILFLGVHSYKRMVHQ